MINNAYSSNPYNTIQDTNQMQNIQPAEDTTRPGRLNENEDMASETGQTQQYGAPPAVSQAFEVNITPEALQQASAAQPPGAMENPGTTQYGYGQTGTQNNRQAAVQAGQIINLTG